jgi:hypothetical protein
MKTLTGRSFITSFLQLSRVGLVWPKPHRPALILPFAKKFFRAGRTHGGTNELDRANILAPGLWFGTHRTPLLPAFTAGLHLRLAYGKSYPVTAAQLLPIRTGFLAPIHFFKLAKNWLEK